MKKLQEIRIQKGFTQKKIAEELKISRPTLNHWETGKYEPSIENLIKLSKYFNVTVDYLIDNEEENLFSEARIPKTEIQQLYDELLPEQQAQIIGFAKGMLVANKSNIFDLTNKK